MTTTLGSGPTLATSKIDGVVFEPMRAHSDQRGLLVPAIDVRDAFWTEPIVYSYMFSVRPGRIKGFARHALQTDRYVHVCGDLRVVLHDGRPDSPTHGVTHEYQLSDHARGRLSIPPGVWHAAHCWGDREAHVINFPTVAYDPANPDKERVDPHTGPISFDWSVQDG